MKHSDSLRRLHHQALLPMVAAIGMALGKTAFASAIVVQNCNDSGLGSLRTAVAGSATGDTIDLSKLNCSRITLTNGAITVGPADLTLSGPTSGSLTIDGNYENGHRNRIFTKSSSGTLSISNVTLSDAKYRTPDGSSMKAAGGCIYAPHSSVLLNEVTLTGCAAVSAGTGGAQGGAVYASTVEMLHAIATGNRAIATKSSSFADGGAVFTSSRITTDVAQITDNIAVTTADHGLASGGGLFSQGPCSIYYSVLSDNLAESGANSKGGGLFQLGAANIRDSTFSNNNAYRGGGAYISNNTAAKIYNSTISGNASGDVGAGLLVQGPLVIANSTIVRNTDGETIANQGAGLEVLSGNSVKLVSNIIALNKSATRDSDVYIIASATVTGNDNIVIASAGNPLPTDTRSVCPRLGPLMDNGSVTWTHALLANSPAIDRGNNTTANFSFDQRGVGYPRVHGANADIGSYELQDKPADDIFNTDFDSACN